MDIPHKDIYRFHQKHSPKKGSDCHLWQDALDPDGYGNFFLLGKNRRAHRVSWLLFRGPIPPDLLIGHTCRNRACVNPQHLKLVTAKENALLNSDSLPAINAQKTHCKAGHPFDKTYQSKRGTVRYCSICQQAKNKRLRANYKDPLKGFI